MDATRLLVTVLLTGSGLLLGVGACLAVHAANLRKHWPPCDCQRPPDPDPPPGPDRPRWPANAAGQRGGTIV